MQQVRTDMATLEKALDVYKLDNHRYQTDEQGLEALRESPVDPILAMATRQLLKKRSNGSLG